MRSLTRPRQALSRIEAGIASRFASKTGRRKLDDRGLPPPSADDYEPTDRPAADDGKNPDAVDSNGIPLTPEERDRRRRRKQDDEHDRQRDEAQEGTDVQSPGSDRGAVGPAAGSIGDNIKPADKKGYTAGRQELARFIKAFGVEQGGRWFTEGKTFEAASELHREQKRQVSTRTLRQNGIVGGIARFARSIAKHLQRK